MVSLINAFLVSLLLLLAYLLLLLYLQLYNHTLEPCVGPEFWEDAPEPSPLPPNVRVQAGRPKKKRNNKNDVPTDPTKLRRQNTIVHCTYCKGAGHNWRSCSARVSSLTCSLLFRTETKNALKFAILNVEM